MAERVGSMRIHGNHLWTLPIVLCLAGFSMAVAQPLQKKGYRLVEREGIGTAVPFLMIVNSARAVGMGGAVVNQVDGESGLYNPGALGIYQLSSRASVNFPIGTTWLPELSNDLSVTTFAASAGQSFLVADGSAGVAPRVAIALGFSRLKIDYADAQRGVPGIASAASREDNSEKVDCFTVAAALDYFARIGVGYTGKRIGSTLDQFSETAKGNAYDLGALLEVPIMKVIAGSGTTARRSSKTWFEVTPSVAYVEANRGDDFGYPDAVFSDPLPRINRSGVAARLAANRGRASYVSLLATHEVESDKAGDWPDIKKSGVELGVMGTLFIRTGNLDDPGSGFDIATMGFGVSSAGVVRWLVESGKLRASSAWRSGFWDRFNVVFDMGWYDHRSDAPIANTKFYRLAVTI